MTIDTHYFDELQSAINHLVPLAEANDDYLFRGHSDSSFQLCSTWSRFTSIPHEDWRPDIDWMLERFRSGLSKLGLSPDGVNSRLDWIEFARHHGVPTPCIDFSYSPYTALFFAFNGLKRTIPVPVEPTYSVVYALNINQLATIWARHSMIPNSEKYTFNHYYHQFLFPRTEPFVKGFPAGTLQLISAPGEKNTRMQRQLGALLYDTIDYQHITATNLEDFLEKEEEPPLMLVDGSSHRTSCVLEKIYISQHLVGAVFKRLELMGITAGNLYQDANGVAMDVINLRNYNPKTQYLRGVKFPTIDDQ